MTTAEKLTEVTAQIRKDIPRLMELREDCIIEYFREGKPYNCKVVETFPSYFNIYFYGEIESINFDYLGGSVYEIIGHDIMVNDVLEWLNKKYVYNSYYMNSSGVILETKITYVNDKYITKWNLQSPYLKDQSEELIKFLYNLIKE